MATIPFLEAKERANAYGFSKKEQLVSNLNVIHSSPGGVGQFSSSCADTSRYVQIRCGTVQRGGDTISRLEFLVPERALRTAAPIGCVPEHHSDGAFAR